MNEETKAIKRLKDITNDYSLNSEDLHYAIILYHLIINLQQENQQLKDRIDKAIDLLINEYESCKGALTNSEYTMVSKHQLLKIEINSIRKTIEILKGSEEY